MKATLKNIRDVLGIHAADVTFSKTGLKNGFKLRGFLPRDALSDLDHNFHMYFKDGAMVVITPGRKSVTSRV